LKTVQRGIGTEVNKRQKRTSGKREGSSMIYLGGVRKKVKKQKEGKGS